MCKLCDEGRPHKHFGSRRSFLKGAAAAGLGATSLNLFAPRPAAANDPPMDSGRPGRRYIIRGGSVMSLDPQVGDFAQADVLVEGKKILAVGANLHAGGAAEIDATGRIVMPGFIDTHHHQFETVLRSFLADGILITGESRILRFSGKARTYNSTPVPPGSDSENLRLETRMTKIASVATYPVSVPRSQPVWTAHERSTAWSAILTEVKTDDDLTGYGIVHVGPAPRVCEYIAKFGEFVRGVDALATTAVWEKLFALTSPRPGAMGGDPAIPSPIERGDRTVTMAAIAGIDIALWDLKGKAAGLPVWRLLGGENRPLVTYATGGYYRPGMPNSAYAEEMAKLVELGYRAVKLKTGLGGIAADVERVGAVRAAIGEQPELMLDMNAPYDLPDCIEFAHRVERHRIFWLEEPLH